MSLEVRFDATSCLLQTTFKGFSGVLFLAIMSRSGCQAFLSFLLFSIVSIAAPGDALDLEYGK